MRTVNHPRLRPNPTLVRAVIDSRLPRYVLAREAGFAQPHQLSTLIHSASVLASPLTVARLRAVAAMVDFGGPLFVEELA